MFKTIIDTIEPWIFKDFCSTKKKHQASQQRAIFYDFPLILGNKHRPSEGRKKEPINHHQSIVIIFYFIKYNF